MTHFKKYWIYYAILIFIIIAAIAYNWTTVKGWFTPNNTNTRSSGCPPGQIVGFNSETQKFECHST
jgi:hypothetical protein